MSKSNFGISIAGYKGDARRDDDFYPTPPEATVALMRDYRGIIPRVVWEPACGDGAMARILAREYDVLATDLVHRGFGMGGIDFRRVDLRGVAIITNPPFNIADDFIRHARALDVPFMALLVKAQFWNAAKRVAVWEKFPPRAIHPLTWHVDFTGQGASTMDLQWCVWGDNVPVSNKPMVRP